MAVFPPYFPNLVEVRCEQSFPGSVRGVNVLYVERDGTSSFATEAGEIGVAMFAFYGAFAAALNTAWSLDEVNLIDRSSAVASTFTYDPGALVGSEAAAALPLGVQLVGTLRTGIAGRRYRGRIFTGGWTEASNDTDGGVNSAVVSTMNTAGQDLLNDLAADGHALQVLSRGNTSPPAPAAWTGFHTPVTAISFDNEWDTLRSRRR